MPSLLRVTIIRGGHVLFYALLLFAFFQKWLCRAIFGSLAIADFTSLSALFSFQKWSAERMGVWLGNPPPPQKKSSTPPFSLSITLFVEGSTICGTCPRPRTLSLSLPMDNTNLCRASLFGVLFGYSHSARKRNQKAGVPTSWIYQMVPWFLFYKLICEGNGLRLLMQRAFSYQVQYDFYTKYIANKNKIFKKNTYLSAGSLDYQDD